MVLKLQTDAVTYERVAPDRFVARITRARVDCDIQGHGVRREDALAAAERSLLAKVVAGAAPAEEPVAIEAEATPDIGAPEHGDDEKTVVTATRSKKKS